LIERAVIKYLTYQDTGTVYRISPLIFVRLNLKYLDITSEKFLMIGNSLKSDALPVLNIGG